MSETAPTELSALLKMAGPGSGTELANVLLEIEQSRIASLLQEAVHAIRSDPIFRKMPEVQDAFNHVSPCTNPEEIPYLVVVPEIRSRLLILATHLESAVRNGIGRNGDENE